MLSKPDNFKFHLDMLAEEAPDGLDSVKAGVKELERLGYIRRYPTKIKGKIVAWNMDVYEKPQMDFPQVEKPLVENPTLITNDLITNELNKKDIKVYTELTFGGHPFLYIYNSYFKQVFKKEHMGVTQEQLDLILSWINELEDMGIDDDGFEEKTSEHFNKLPSSNNGNIIAFRQASRRYFDVEILF